jgi:hypothetical protein
MVFVADTLAAHLFFWKDRKKIKELHPTQEAKNNAIKKVG